MDYVHVFAYLRRCITESEFKELVERVAMLVDEFSDESEAVSHVLAKMGFESIGAE